MPETVHRIRKQRWVVHAPSAADAFRLRMMLRSEQESVLELFESAFDAEEFRQHDIHLKRLEIQLTANNTLIASDGFVSSLREEIASQIAEALRAGVITRDANNGSTPQKNELADLDLLLRYLRTGILDWSIAHLSAEEVRLRFYSTYIEHQRALWHNIIDDAEDIAFGQRLRQLLSPEEVLELASEMSGTSGETSAATQSLAGVLEDDAAHSSPLQAFESLLGSLRTGTSGPSEGDTDRDSTAELLRAQLREHLSDIARHLLAHSEANAFLLRLLHLLDRTDVIELVREIAELRTSASGASSGVDEVRVVMTILAVAEQYFSLHGQLLVSMAVLRECIEGSIKDTRRGFEVLLRVELVPSDAEVFEAFIDALPFGAMLGYAHDAEAPSSSRLSTEFIEKDDLSLRANVIALDSDALIDSISRTTTSHPVPNIGLDPDGSDEKPLFTAQLAGLVLLHPYVARLFSATGILTAGSREIPASSLPHAAALLHFLATGREKAYEFELGFIKVLLGLRPEAPLFAMDGLLTSQDKEEASALLASVIAHWSILKNTSIDGLRASFLDRNGLLRENENGWALHIDRKPYDMLIDQIPWALSIVKLPWMTKPINLEW